MERRLTGLPGRTKLTKPTGLPGLTKRSRLTGRTDRANRTSRTDRPDRTDRTNRANFLEVAVEPNLEFKKKLSRVCGEMHFFLSAGFVAGPIWTNLEKHVVF